MHHLCETAAVDGPSGEHSAWRAVAPPAHTPARVSLGGGIAAHCRHFPDDAQSAASLATALRRVVLEQAHSLVHSTLHAGADAERSEQQRAHCTVLLRCAIETLSCLVEAQRVESAVRPAPPRPACLRQARNMRAGGAWQGSPRQGQPLKQTSNPAPPRHGHVINRRHAIQVCVPDSPRRAKCHTHGAAAAGEGDAATPEPEEQVPGGVPEPHAARGLPQDEEAVLDAWRSVRSCHRVSLAAADLMHVVATETEGYDGTASEAGGVIGAASSGLPARAPGQERAFGAVKAAFDEFLDRAACVSRPPLWSLPRDPCPLPF